MRKFAPIFAILVIATFLFRLPALINARDLNSDAAVVGLQAMHMLHGQWSWFLWGAGYQSSLDSAITAVAFAIFGVSPLALMLMPIIGHLIVILLTLSILHKRIGLALATVCVLPLVITPWAVSSVVIFPPRQWCVTLIFVSVWLLDGASESRRPLVRYGFGAFFAIAAIYVDLFALLFVPGILVLLVMCIFDPDRATSNGGTPVTRFAASFVGIFAGIMLVLCSRLSPQSANSPARMDPSRIAFNAQLLWQQCVPFSLGYALYHDSDIPTDRSLWTAPMPWYALQVLGGWSLAMFIVCGGALGFSSGPWKLRRLGIFGLCIAISVPILFLLSVQPYDMWAARYLGPIFWMAPFALAPLAARWGTGKLAIAMTPYLLVALVGGWLSYGFWVKGPLLQNHAQVVNAETDELCQFLRQRNIHAAFTDYWLAYRLTFLDQENPIFAPLDHDRYPPYRIAAENEPIRAYVFHPTWTRSPNQQEIESQLQSQKIPYETAQVNRFTILLTRPTPAGPVSQPEPTE